MVCYTLRRPRLIYLNIPRNIPNSSTSCGWRRYLIPISFYLASVQVTLCSGGRFILHAIHTNRNSISVSFPHVSPASAGGLVAIRMERSGALRARSSFAVIASLFATASAHAAPPALLPALCIERTKEYDSVFSTCSYGTLAFNPNRQCTNATSNCSARGVCFFGKCFCKPGSRGDFCQLTAPPPLPCREPTRAASYRRRFDSCFRHPDYGSAVIPKARWEKAQEAEALLWKKSRKSDAQSGDRALGHVQFFGRYAALPVGNLGRIVELGSGQWTQTHFMLNARPDINATSITLVDPGINGYLRSGNALYKNGFLNGVPVDLHSIGAEEVPYSENETFDVVVMINCIEHTFNAFATLETAYRLLRPRGLFIFQERAVRLSENDQIYHPVRLPLHFYDWWLGLLYDEIYRFRGKHPTLKRFLEGEVYFIGRKNGRKTRN